MNDEKTLSLLVKRSQPMLRLFTRTKTEIRYNSVMAKWDEHYDRFPPSRGGYTGLRYITPAD